MKRITNFWIGGGLILSLVFCATAQGQTFSVNGEAPTVAAAPEIAPSRVSRQVGLIADAEWLNWRTASSNQDFASFTDPVWLTDRSTESVAPQGSGIRARLGYRAASGWDVSWSYTYFDGDDSSSVAATADPSSVLTSPISVLDLPLNDAAVDATTQINVHDLEFGRWFAWNDAAAFRPFGGLRWAQLDETLDGKYRYDDLANVLRSNEFAHSSQMDGYGVRMGGEAECNLFGGFSLFGRGAGSVLAGTVESTSLEKDEVQGTVLNRRVSATKAVSSIEAAAGLAWQIQGFKIKGGYELNSWFNASSLNAKDSDVLTHGFFAGASWNY